MVPIVTAGDDQAGDASAFDLLASLARKPVDDAVEGYRDAMRAAYWDDHDLTLTTGIAFGGASRLLAAASETEDADAAYRYWSAAKGLTYDYASFAWPGWDQEGIVISVNEAAAGLAAARTNLSLAIDLDKGDLARSRAHWMIGAHLLTSGDVAAARSEFERAVELAERAGETTDAELGRAYVALADATAGKDSAAGDLAAAIEQLASLEHGQDLVDQVVTAKRVVLGN